MQELLAPSNAKDIQDAAQATGTVIPVHVYLYSHYSHQYGYYFHSSQQLQDLVASLNPKLVRVVGEL